MAGFRDHMAWIMTFVLWVSNECLGPDGWFFLWTGIKQIFAHTAAFCVFVAQWIWKNTAALGVSFGKELYAQLAVDALLHICYTTGTGLQATGIIVSGLFVSYAVFAFGYSVWTFCLYPNTVSQQVLSSHAGHVFLPLVLAWIVLGVVRFETEQQGGQNPEKHHGPQKHLQQDSSERTNAVCNSHSASGVAGVLDTTVPFDKVTTGTPSPADPTRQDEHVIMTPSPTRLDCRTTTTPFDFRQDNLKRRREVVEDHDNPLNMRGSKSLKGLLEEETDRDNMEF